MKRLTHLLWVAIASVMVLGGAALPASASHSFRSQGLDDVLAAAAAKKPADMTTNEFAAVILAVTWPEAAGNSTNAPSPMTIFSCFEVNPANAQGWTGSWRYSPYDGAYDASGAATRPSPLTQTFYNYAAGGYEYRVWLRKDTTYQIHVGSYRPLGQNARTSLVWFQSNGLCVDGVCP